MFNKDYLREQLGRGDMYNMLSDLYYLFEAGNSAIQDESLMTNEGYNKAIQILIDYIGEEDV